MTITTTEEAHAMADETTPKKSTRPTTRAGRAARSATAQAEGKKTTRDRRPASTASQEPIRHWIKELRVALFLSQGQLADAAGITRETLSEYESGKREPRGATMRRIAEAMGVTPTWRIYDLPEPVARILIDMPEEMEPPAARSVDPEEPTEAPRGTGKPTGDPGQGPAVETPQESVEAPWFVGGDGAFIPAFANLPTELNAHTAQTVIQRLRVVSQEWHQQVDPEALWHFLVTWGQYAITTKQRKAGRVNEAQAQRELDQFIRDIVTPIYEHSLKQAGRGGEGG